MNRHKNPNRKRTADKKGFRLTQSIQYSDHALKSMFTAADALLPIDETRRAGTCRLLQHEFRSRTVRPQQDNRLLFVSLLRYTDRHLPCLHLLGCIAMLLMLLTMSLYFPTPQDAGVMVFASMTLPCFLVFFSVFEFRQICFAGMGELSKTCFFHIRQLAALSMIFSGILNLMAVSAAIILVGRQWKIRLLHLGLYVLVPFLFMQCVCFGCMLLEKIRRHTWLCAAFLLPAAVFCLAAFQRPALYTESALFFWAAALFAGIVIFAGEMKLLFAKLDKGEILCTDWN
ncbi:MAG: hypothetical protein K2P48_06415 [Lachnospiraceae bacterium]|nr:hypothetical protein [Lachnospiraceae bacterium]